MGASGDAPPSLIAELAGQWTGESTRTLAGLPASESSSNARRYWVEGAIVRGEILSSADGRLEAAQVAIVPREFGFVKMLTLKGDVPDLFVGTPAEGGILWSSVDSDRIKYIERVAGDGEDRRLEVLMVETAGEKASVIETLLPSEDALTGVIGAEIQSVEEIEPLVLPPMAEMELVDRIGQLTKQRDDARLDSESTVRELAAAWRQSEDLEAKLAAQSTELAQLAARLESGEGSGGEDDVDARLLAAESELVEARRWADDLEKSLGEQTALADATGERVSLLEGDLVKVTAERDDLKSQIEQQISDSELASVQLAEARDRIAELTRSVGNLEGRLEGMVPEEDAAGFKAEHAAAAAALLAANARISELEDELQATVEQGQGSSEQVVGLSAELAEITVERDSLQTRLESAIADAEALQVAKAELESRNADLAEARAQVSALEETVTALEQAAQESAGRSSAETDEAAEEIARLAGLLAAAELGKNQVSTELEAVQSELETVRNQIADSETQLSALRDEIIRANKEAEESITKVTAERDSALLELQLKKVELAAATESVANLENELSALSSAESAESDENAQVAELENRLAETFARSEQRQEEIEDLQGDVINLEAENRKLATRVADLAARVANERPEGTPMADTSVMANLERQLADEKSTRTRLEASNQALLVQIRELEIELAEARDLENQPATAPPARVVAATTEPTAVPRPATTVATESPPIVAFDSRASPQRPSEPVPATPEPAVPEVPSAVSFRSPETQSGGTTAASGRRPPRRPDESRAASVNTPSTPPANAGQNAFLVQVVRGLPLNGFRRAGADSLVVIDGRTYRIGQVVDAQHGLRFTRIDSDSIVFSGPDNGEYRFTL